MWYIVQFDAAWVVCANSMCRAEFTYKSIAGKRKCPKCRMDNRHCIKKMKENRMDGKLQEALLNIGCEPSPLTRRIPLSFVYWRPHGVFKCKPCGHHALMSLLLAGHHGLYDGISVAEKLGIEWPYETADRFLQLPGTAFLSSASEFIQAWEPKNLEEWEIRLLGDICFIK